MDWPLYLTALLAISSFGVLAWLYSLVRKNVSFVDSIWSLFFLLAAGIYAAAAGDLTARSSLLVVLVAVWALRLSIYITARNWGEPEDRRYQKIRANNQPGFEFKSLYIVFLLQGLLAWIISLPLLGALGANTSFQWLDLAAVALWTIGFVFEAGGDYQMAKFKRDPDNSDDVLDQGLWRYTRHPNYFGDFCIWWSFYLFALASGAWWSIVAPLLMSFLLLKVSGVVLLEKTISGRRPKYAGYIQRTNAFFPGPPNTTGKEMEGAA